MEYPIVGSYLLDLRLPAAERIGWLNSALAAAQLLHNQRYEGAILGNIGIAHADLKDYRKAIDYYEQRLPISRAIGDRRGEGCVLSNLGVAYKNLGEYEKARASTDHSPRSQ
jgi:tetratricopeptide (TPR) repeat protein